MVLHSASGKIIDQLQKKRNAARKAKTQQTTGKTQNVSTTPIPSTITPCQQSQTQMIQQHLSYPQPPVHVQHDHAASQHILYEPVQQRYVTGPSSIECVQFHIPKQEDITKPQPCSGDLFTSQSTRDLDEIDDIEAICQPMRSQRPSLITVRSDPQPTRLESILTNPQFMNVVPASIEFRQESKNECNYYIMPLQSGHIERPATPVLTSSMEGRQYTPGADSTTDYSSEFVTPQGLKTSVYNMYGKEVQSINDSVSFFQMYEPTHYKTTEAVGQGSAFNGNMPAFPQEPSETVADSRHNDTSEDHSCQIYSPTQTALSNPPISSCPSTLQGYSISGNNLQQSDNDSEYICVYHLQEQCKGKCLHNHRPNQYQWQFRISDDEWEHFSPNSNEATERRYCCPSKEYCYIPFKNEGLVKVNFEEMSASGSKFPLPIRRLTTLSTESPDMTSDMLTSMTVWLWYLEESPNHWVQFGQKKRKGQNPSADSCKIERAYLENPCGSTVVSVKKAKYRLDFTSMEKEHLKAGHRVRIRRRPLFNQSH